MTPSTKIAPDALSCPNTPATKAAWLAGHEEATRKKLARAKTRDVLWSWTRLAAFLAAFGPWFIIPHRSLLAGGLTVAFVGLFLAAVVIHLGVQARRRFYRQAIWIIEEAARRLGGGVVVLRDGDRPADPADAEARLDSICDDGPTWSLSGQEWDDLDLYASPAGLFGLLNRTSTATGARRLRDCGERMLLSVDRIRARQASVRWLGEHSAERIGLMACLAGLRGADDRLEQFTLAIRRARPFPFAVVSWVLRLWSVPATGLFLYCLIQMFVGSPLGILILPIFVINGILFLLIRKRVQAALKPWQLLGQIMRDILAVARQGHTVLPVEGELQVLRSHFSAVVESGALASLARRHAWADAGGPFHVILNSLFFYDLHVLEMILGRVIPHRDDFLRCLSAAGDLEALCSLGCFAWEQPVATYPTAAAKMEICITGGVHPLVRPSRTVANDLHVSPETRMWIVTGPNAAGKSTFLRTAGISVLLAQIGSAVCAREMTFTPVRLLTDLRVRDSLSKEESYFMSEVRLLRRMVRPDQSEPPMLGLIDEPFRGTNSAEKRAASLALVEHLLATRDFYLVATHENALTALATGSPARNYHFRETLEPAGVTFDYLLRSGPAHTTTAIQILEREGYPRTFLDNARKWIGEPDRPSRA